MAGWVVKAEPFIRGGGDQNQMSALRRRVALGPADRTADRRDEEARPAEDRRNVSRRDIGHFLGFEAKFRLHEGDEGRIDQPLDRAFIDDIAAIWSASP